ncbi:MAG TPA: YegP family protein [Kofleriaceae bacterium]|nr:YegP family protein [Kofleriaceae bacterium]
MRNIASLITVLALSFATLSVTACATSGDEQMGDEYSDAESNASAPGKLKLWQSTDGQWRFHVVSGNGRTLLTSEGYTSRTGAVNGILSVLDNGVDPAMYQVNKTATGYNLRLRAANWETIAFTQVYSTKSSATRAITSCVNAVTSHLDVLEANTSGARVEVLESSAGFRFNVHAQNGEVVLSSESYTTKAAAFNGAFAVQAASANATAFAIKTATDGRFYFTVSADNGQIVGVSQLYTTKTAAQNGIASVQSLLRGIELL